MHITSATESFLKWFTRTGAVTVIVVAAAVLFGWAFDVPNLKSILPGLASMKANSALAFVVAGIALLCLSEAAPPRVFLAGRVLAAAVAAIGGLTLLEYVSGLGLGIDQLLFRDLSAPASVKYPGRMAPASALNFVLIGLSLLGLKARSTLCADMARWTLLPVHLSGVLALLGYTYGVSSLYNVAAFVSVAVHTAILFTLLSFCIFIANRSRGFMKVVVSDSAGGSVARYLIPAIPAIILLLSYLCHAGEKAGLYDGNFRRAMMVASTMAVLMFLVARVTVALYKSDIKRKLADAEIIAINASLEQRVKDRTRELEQTLAEVKQLNGLLPICSYCKKVRDDKDYWQTVETYVMARTDARFSHGICPSCLPKARAEMGLKPRVA